MTADLLPVVAVLPRTVRMRSSAEFRNVVRHGVRTGRPTLVVHAAWSPPPADGVRVGFVVAKAVGNAVERNRVKRRLRHLAQGLVPLTPVGTQVVVRALPRAATSPAQVPDDLRDAWAKTLGRLRARADQPSRDVS